MAGAQRVVLFTGDGKGKTTAALGMVVRAIGHEMTALVVQFIKSSGRTGELAALDHLSGVEIVQTGRGFVPPRDDLRFTDHQAAAQDGLHRAREAVASGQYDLVVLDEVCVAVATGLISEGSVAELIETSAPRTCLVLTGRGATERLISLADTVTEMRCVKHAHREGTPAQRGVEF